MESQAAPRPHDRPPPIRADSLVFPTDRLPQLAVDVVKNLPELVDESVDETAPGAVTPDKYLFNLWAQTETQTELRWRKPHNADAFSTLSYQIQLKVGTASWVDLTEIRLCVFRIYFVDGKAIFGRTKITQSEGTSLVRMRIRPIGIVQLGGGQDEKKFGPWTNDILFSLEGSASKH